ncbi:hypothetical protein C0993_002537, partial [Termitomyces sp. T159_Od127]
MAINPDLEECVQLRGWYDSTGAGQSFQVQSNAGGGGVARGFKREEIRSLAEVKESQLGQQDKVEYFSTKATIMHIKSDNIYYPACPTTGCNKKVTPVDGNWRCEKCNKSFEVPGNRYVISLSVADHSAQALLQGFNDVGLTIFGMPADDLARIKENDEAKFNGILHLAKFKTFKFFCRASQEEYN